MTEPCPPLPLRPADRLRRFLAAGSLWHSASAYRHLAEAQRGEERLGTAEACAKAAVEKAREALGPCRADSDWAAALQPALAGLEQLRAALEKERTVVFLQQSVAVAPELPAGRVLVAAAPYQPDAAGSDNNFE